MEDEVRLLFAKAVDSVKIEHYPVLLENGVQHKRFEMHPCCLSTQTMNGLTRWCYTALSNLAVLTQGKVVTA